MQTINVSLGVMLILSGALVILLCLPLLKDKIGPNRWYGVRIREAYQSPENWFKLQRYGAAQLIRWACVVTAFGVAALFVPFREDQSTLVFLLPYFR